MIVEVNTRSHGNCHIELCKYDMRRMCVILRYRRPMAGREAIPFTTFNLYGGPLLRSPGEDIGGFFLCRGNEILSRGNEILSRSHEILSRGNEIVSRSLEIAISFPRDSISFPRDSYLVGTR